MFLVSDLPFCLIRRVREPKNKVGTIFLTNTIYCTYIFIKLDNDLFDEFAIPRIKKELLIATNTIYYTYLFIKVDNEQKKLY